MHFIKHIWNPLSGGPPQNGRTHNIIIVHTIEPSIFFQILCKKMSQLHVLQTSHTHTKLTEVIDPNFSMNKTDTYR